MVKFCRRRAVILFFLLLVGLYCFRSNISIIFVNPNVKYYKTVNIPSKSFDVKLLERKKITFITPTRGRSSLIDTYESIVAQTSANWEHLITYQLIKCKVNGQHGFQHLPFFLRKRFPSLSKSPKKTKFLCAPRNVSNDNCAAEVRNVALSYTKTDYVGFLDDDDTISNDYVEKFFSHIITDFFNDVVVFRMYQASNPTSTIPSYNIRNLKVCNFGISFAGKTTLFQKFKFTPSTFEDYDMLKRLLEAGKRLILTNDITYYVKGTGPTYGHGITLKKRLPDPFLLNTHDYGDADRRKHQTGFNCNKDKGGNTKEIRFEYKSKKMAKEYIGELHSKLLERMHELYPECLTINQQNGFFIPNTTFLGVVHSSSNDDSQTFTIQVLNENMKVVQNWIFGQVKFNDWEGNFYFPSFSKENFNNGEIDDSLCFSMGLMNVGFSAMKKG